MRGAPGRTRSSSGRPEISPASSSTAIPRPGWLWSGVCAHYFSHGLFLDDEALLRNAHRLTGIPGVLMQGRFDISLGTRAAWDLARAWPDAELLIAEDAGHFDKDTKVQFVYDAIDRFAS